MPQVSVIIPTYNLSGVLVHRSIASVLAQTHSDLECIVVDDGSTDDTEAKVRAVAASDSRVRYIKKANGGQASARNLGMKEARGELIAFNDHDDKYLPDYLERALQAFITVPKAAYLSSWVVNRSSDGRETVYRPELDPFWKLAVGNGWVFRASSLRESNLSFDESVSGFEDLDFHIQCHRAGLVGNVIPEPLRRYYVSPPRLVGGGSYSSSNYARQADHFRAFMKKNEATYNREGSAAIAWLNQYCASLCLKANRMHDARAASMRSLRASYSSLALRDLLLSFLGFTAYRWLYDTKKKLRS